MIQANELRIGNAIYEDTVDLETGNQIMQLVTVEARTIVQCSMRVSGFHPIPLTPEILEKCGAIKAQTRDDFYRVGGLIVIFDRDGDASILKSLRHGDTAYLTTLKHLHQLQNLVHALTGIELEFERSVATKMPQGDEAD